MFKVNKVMNKGLCKLQLCAVLLAVLALGVPLAAAQAGNLELMHVQGNVYLVVGGGGNTVLQIGPQGVLVVDTKLAAASEELLALIRSKTDAPIRWIVNTHVHRDHIGGNALLSAAGTNLEGGGAAIHGHANIVGSLVRSGDDNHDGWPQDTYFDGALEIHANGESVRIIHMPNAHTDGDSIVHFRGSDVIAAGDIFVTTTYPFIDTANGGSAKGIIDALNYMLQLAVPARNQQGGTMLIPGLGRITDEYELVNYRDMMTIIYERIAQAVAQGMSLIEVKAAALTRDYDPRYGSDSGFWTTEMFIEAVYDELAR